MTSVFTQLGSQNVAGFLQGFSELGTTKLNLASRIAQDVLYDISAFLDVKLNNLCTALLMQACLTLSLCSRGTSAMMLPLRCSLPLHGYGAATPCLMVGSNLPIKAFTVLPLHSHATNDTTVDSELFAAEGRSCLSCQPA